MYNISDYQVGRVIDAAIKIVSANQKEPQITNSAILASQLINIIGKPDMTAAQCKNCCYLAMRIDDEAPFWGESRFCQYDYIDAVANSIRNVNIEKLLNLDFDSFAVAMIWLAQDKRETYSEQPHEQEPLELDIWEE